MNDKVISNCCASYQSLLKVAAGLMWSQWRLFTAPYRCCVTLSKAARRDEPKRQSVPSQDREDVESRNAGPLESLAFERISKGLAPPREIYEAQNRDRIDWSKVPDWARPADPELFAGCPHEG